MTALEPRCKRLKLYLSAALVAVEPPLCQFMAVGVALSLAGIVVTAQAQAVLLAMQAGGSNALPFISGSDCGSHRVVSVDME